MKKREDKWYLTFLYSRKGCKRGKILLKATGEDEAREEAKIIWWKKVKEARALRLQNNRDRPGDPRIVLCTIHTYDLYK